jgi:exosome complex exonuclease RRP6
LHSFNCATCYAGGSNDFEYFQTFRECKEGLGSLGEEISGLIGELCYFSRPQPGSQLLSADLLDPTNFESIIDILDDVLDHADLKFDELAGIDTSKRSYKLKDVVDRERLMNSNSLDIPKPQLRFDPPVNNRRDEPHVPLLRGGKPHCTVPLEKSISNSAHIYESEMCLLDYEALVAEMGPVREPFLEPAPCATHPFELVQTEGAMRNLAATLRDGNFSEIAVDLEHHSYRTFQGITCLMQVC